MIANVNPGLYTKLGFSAIP